MDSIGQLCLLILILLIFSALFSTAETSITSMGDTKLKIFRERFPFLKNMVDWVLKNRQKVLSAILIGNNLANIASSAVATMLATALLSQKGVGYAVMIMTFLIVIFGEVLPKSIAMVRTDRALMISLPVVRLTGLILTPFVWLVNKITILLGKLLGIDLSIVNSFVTREEIEQVVKSGEASGAIEESERRMIHGIISFEETRVVAIMVPRTDMDVLELGQTIDEVMSFVQEKGHSRIPIYEETLDNIVGVLYVKDIIPNLHAGKTDVKIDDLMRVPLFVPETMKIPDLFTMMKAQRIHIAVVVDEYGGTAGIVTLEDLLEEIVGEIQDEYDTEEAPPIVQTAPDTYKVDGWVPLEDLSEHLGYAFESEDVDSVGGFVLEKLGTIPFKGECFEFGPWHFEVCDVEDHRVNQVVISKNNPTVEEGPGE